MTETWIAIDQVVEFERISRMEIYRRMRPGDRSFLPSRSRDDGKPGRLIDGSFMTPDAKERWRQSRLRKVIEAAPGARTGTSPQTSLFPQLDRDREVASIFRSEFEREEAFRKLRIIQPSNHEFSVLGLETSRALMKAIEKETGVPVSTQQKWRLAYRKGGLLGLVNKRPGPVKGSGEVLEPWMKMQLDEPWANGKTYQQCYKHLKDFITFKHHTSTGLYYPYFVPSRLTVWRYLKSQDALKRAARQGPEAMHAACGHIDRSYVGLTSLERVESDECKLNLFSYDRRRPVNRRGEPWIRRYWILTFYDARSMYPLVWTLCEGSQYELRHGVSVQDEINLFTGLIQTFGVPAAIHSDRGRFRGKEWGGEPYQQRIDKEFAPANGVLQRVGQLAGLPDGIRHNMPRIHNPRGSRLERFHRWVADWFRGKPGWIGANTRERKMTHGDEEAEKHKLWCVGKLPPGEPSPLLEKEEILLQVNAMMEAWRDHNSEGTDMNGMTPRAVFTQCAPPSGFRRISDKQLAFATAQHFENERIELGGTIQLRDGTRYFHPLLTELAGQKREVVRLRDDHSFITVLPAQKGEEAVTAPRKTRVGMNDPDQLAKQMEILNRLRKIAGETTKVLEYEPGANFPDSELPQATHVIRPAEFFAVQQPADLAPVSRQELEPFTPEMEISSMEWQRRGKGPRPKPLDFADLES